ncbi:PTS sugar transporter subunit IIA [Pectinatus haikarae]|uniref:PTS system galactitol-specific IIA component n=1 Tax=Pectinatus haikarae TaxID=349096 RepID=A0ABT9YA30_9FIRM|nr:PTS sugar transporter subunit IIA [Pectinatus haikarae]MDQ0204391.1 PTS system galactitol-specific IIA component [Pectinatus haikarae]
MSTHTLFNEKLIFFDKIPSDNFSAIKILGDELVKAGYILPAYIKTVSKREIDFPTGIALRSSGVAIPHAAPENNVLKDGIAVLRLKKPVIFHSMEDSEDKLSVSIIFMLALREANGHISMLQKLFRIFQQNDLMQKLLIADNTEKFQTLMLENMQ